jgi:hypothetical protein
MSESDLQIATAGLGFVVAAEKRFGKPPFAVYASYISSFVKSGACSTALILVLVLFMLASKHVKGSKLMNFDG